MCKSGSIPWSTLTLKDFIWIEVFYSLIQNEENKILEQKAYFDADQRFLLFDLANSTRLKMSMGKTSSLLKQKDLPSSALNKKEEVSPEMKKEFLKHLQSSFKNK